MVFLKLFDVCHLILATLMPGCITFGISGRPIDVRKYIRYVQNFPAKKENWELLPKPYTHTHTCMYDNHSRNKADYS